MMVFNEDSNRNPDPPDAVQSGSLDILLGSLRIFDVTIRDDRRNVNLVSILNVFTNIVDIDSIDFRPFSLLICSPTIR